MTRSPAPNRALRRLLAEAGWTEDQLAGRINYVAADSGLTVRLDRRSVAHWLAGRRPRPPVPELIVEAFSRALDRTVTLADIGLAARSSAWCRRLPDPAADAADPQTQTGADPFSLQGQDVVTVLKQLARHDQARRQLLFSGVYSLAAMAVPGWDQAAAQQPAAAVGRSPRASMQRLEAGQVEAAEQMTRVFSDTADAFGGGRARLALATYIASDVAPQLRAPGSPRLRDRMLSATTQLSYLCAFMCFDDEQHALAQRYYRTTLDLAAENNDPVAYAITLRAMSVQARLLGHHQQAVQLAENAATSSRGKVDPMRQAFFYGQVAVAAAATGDRVDAMSALTVAERHLERSTSQTGPRTGPNADAPVGGYHPAALAHQQAAVFALLGDNTNAITALTESVRHRPLQERRSRAITLARLAELHLQHGSLEQAVGTWHAFLDDYPYLTAGRATTALRTLRSRIRPFAANPAAKNLLLRAASVGVGLKVTRRL